MYYKGSQTESQQRYLENKIAKCYKDAFLNVRTTVTCSYYYHLYRRGLVNRKLSERRIVRHRILDVFEE